MMQATSGGAAVKFRIAMWAVAGFFVAVAWALYSFAMAPMAVSPANPLVWTLAWLTCPVVMAGFHLHYGLHLYWVLPANAATYALAGLLVETLRRPWTRESLM
jgi:hypothetical protein